MKGKPEPGDKVTMIVSGPEMIGVFTVKAEVEPNCWSVEESRDVMLFEDKHRSNHPGGVLPLGAWEYQSEVR